MRQLLFILFILSVASAQTIEYTLSMPEPWTHYFHVTQTIKGAKKKHLDFVMPVWTPGSYMIREYPKNVEGFSARTEKSESPRWEKLDKNTWRVYSNKAKTVTVSYRVYAFNKGIRYAFLDDMHGFTSPASTFMYVEGYANRKATLVIDLYEDFTTVSTGLERLPGDGFVFSVPDFDVLVDSPIEMGNQVVLDFEVKGVPHEIAIYGEGNYDSTDIVEDTKTLVEETVKMFGEIPYERYVFIVLLSKYGGGGLEHANSCVLGYGNYNFKPESRRMRWRGLVAHEFFHAYNVKRIRAKTLGPFDYSKENYTTLLWVMEGFTSYYGGRLMLRAGFTKPKAYLNRFASSLEAVYLNRGDEFQSVSEASFDSWIRYYRRNENSPNSEVNYYSKGSVIAGMLDLLIMHNTEGDKNLDDLMRYLYTKYYKKKTRGFTEVEFRSAAERLSKMNLEDFFADYIHGTEKIDYEEYLAFAGLELSRVDTAREGGKPFLGISTKESNGKLIIRNVYRDTPAWDYGLNVDDEIIAVNGLRVSESDFTARLSESNPGDRVMLTISRGDRLREMEVVLGEKDRTDFSISKIAEPTELQKEIYGIWLGEEWDD